MARAPPHWVERDFRAYLRCGILAHGFARIRCEACAAERLVAFSCKGRGVCPSCNTRRMVEVAAHLADHVLPPLPIRQWVCSLPKRVRPFLPRDPALAGAVLRILLRAIRFASTDTHQLERTLQRRVLRLFSRRGLLDDHTVAVMLTWRVAGGFSLDASVRIHGSDTAGRERLIRYCARPPFALERRADCFATLFVPSYLTPCAAERLDDSPLLSAAHHPRRWRLIPRESV